MLPIFYTFDEEGRKWVWIMRQGEYFYQCAQKRNSVVYIIIVITTSSGKSEGLRNGRRQPNVRWSHGPWGQYILKVVSHLNTRTATTFKTVHAVTTPQFRSCTGWNWVTREVSVAGPPCPFCGVKNLFLGYAVKMSYIKCLHHILNRLIHEWECIWIFP